MFAKILITNRGGVGGLRPAVLLALALGASGWPAGPALACQSSMGETERYLEAQRERRNHADVVVIGTWAPDTGCTEQCTARLTVSETHRGSAYPELKVRYTIPESMCDFFEPLRIARGLFYLKRDENAETYSLVDWTEQEPSA